MTDLSGCRSSSNAATCRNKWPFVSTGGAKLFVAWLVVACLILATSSMSVYGQAFKFVVANSNGGTASVINADTNVLQVPALTAGTLPHAVAFGNGKFAVTDRTSGTVRIFNAATNALLATLSVGTTPTAIRFASGKFAIVDNNGGGVGSVVFIDANTNVQLGSPVVVGTNPRRIAFGDGRFAVVNQSDNTMTTISAGTLEVIGVVAVGSSPRGVAFGDGKFAVTNFSSNSVTLVDAADSTTSIAVGAGPTRVAFGDGKFAVSCFSGNAISLISSAGGPAVTLAPGASVLSPNAIAFGGGRFCVANRNSDNAVLINPVTNSIVATVSVGDGPREAAYVNGKFAVSSRDSDQVHIIDATTTTDSVLATLAVGDQPLGMAGGSTDVIAPEITMCAADRTEAAEGDCQVEVPDLTGEVSVTDNVDMDIEVTQNINPPTRIGLGETVITLTATDDAGNFDKCTAVITVVDVDAPGFVMCDGDMTLTANAVCEQTVPNLLSFVSATDHCDTDVEITQSPSSGALIEGAGDTVVVFRAEDDAGNVTTCTSTVTVEDNDDPVITSCAASSTVGTDQNCEGLVPHYAGLTSATDNCDGSVAVTQSPTANSLVGLGATTVLITATDNNGNTDTCTAVVTVVDDDNPEITSCAPTRTLAADGDCESLMPAFIGNVSASDNCDGSLDVTQDIMSGTTIQLGSTTVVITVTDDAGNTDTCTATATVLDIGDPTITDCDADVTLGTDENCENVLPNLAGDVSATDNCDTDVSIAQGTAAGTIIDLEDTLVVMTFTDNVGNTSTCVVTVTVEDDDDPIITGCDLDRTVAADANCDGLIPNLAGLVSVADNCDTNVSVTQDPVANDTAEPGLVVVEITAVDNYGNSDACTVAVTVVEQTAPVITVCASSFTVSADSECEYLVVDLTGGVTATDNCDSDVDITQSPDSGETLGLGSHVVVFTATDDAENTDSCSITIMVLDTTPLEITYCDVDMTLAADENCEQFLPDLTEEISVTDNCDTDIQIVQVPAEGTTLGLGDTVVTLTATDDEGETDVCTAVVTVIDVHGPDIVSCNFDMTLVADENCEHVAPDIAGLVSAVDNCDSDVDVSQEPDVGEALDLGETVIVVTAMDTTGNSSTCSVTIDVIDETPPDIASCGADLTISADEDCIGDAPDVTGGVEASDNCDDITITQSPAEFDDLQLGENVVIVTVEDGSENTSTCTVVVTVVDDESPILSGCSTDITVGTDTNCEGMIPDVFEYIDVDDNCDSDVMVSQGPTEGTTVGLGVTMVTIMATDEYGNTAECTVEVTVVDDDPPFFTNCSADKTLSAEGNCTAVLPDLRTNVMADDNCDTDVVITQSPMSNTVLPLGITTVTFKATDNFGNMQTCNAIVEVIDDAPPIVLNCNFDRTLAADEECEEQIPNLVAEISATDNCDTVLAITQSPAAFEVVGVGEHVVVVTVEDDYGNTAECTAVIEVLDIDDPELSECPDDLTLSANENCRALAPDILGDMFVSDNCDSEPALTQSPAVGNSIDLGATVIWITAEDAAGNTDLCSVVVTVVDDSPPDLVCAAPTSDVVDSTCQTAIPDVLADTVVSDNCDTLDGIEISQDPEENELVMRGKHVITVTAADSVGNSSTCTVVFTAVDETDPVIISGCPSDLTMASDENCEIVVPDFAELVSATDNCDSVTISQSPAAGALVYGSGEHVVVVTATDLDGNTDVCSAVITVLDGFDPVIECPDDVTVSCDDDIFPFFNPVVGQAWVHDACDPEPMLMFEDKSTGSCHDGENVVLVVTRTWMAMDASGNTASCVQIITGDGPGGGGDGDGGDNPPEITISSSDITLEYCVASGPVPLAGDVEVSDSDSSNFNNGALRVSIEGATADDEIGITEDSDFRIVDGVLFAVENGDISFELGLVTGGDNGEDFIVLFTSAAATVERVEALIASLTFENGNDKPVVDPDGFERTVSIRVSDGDGGESESVEISINFATFNRPPVVTAPGSQVAFEDVELFILGVSVSDPDIEDGSDTVLSVSIKADFGTVEPSLVVGTLEEINDEIAVLVYLGDEDLNGDDTIKVLVDDLNVDAKGGALTDTAVIDIDVIPVNDAPSFDKIEDDSVVIVGGTVMIDEDADGDNPPVFATGGVVRVAGWAQNVLAGPDNEDDQILTFTVTNDNPDLFDVEPELVFPGVDSTLSADLEFVLAENAHGNAKITVVLSDNGGTANGGVDTAGVVECFIMVMPVNDEPELISAPADMTLSEDDEDMLIDLGAIFDDVDIETDGDFLTFATVSNDGMDVLDISVDGNDLVVSLLDDQHGQAVIVVSATDQHGSSATATKVITVDPVNDPPFVNDPAIITITAVDNSGSTSTAAITDVIKASEDSGPLEIDISDVFDDVDIVTDGDSLELSVISNDNMPLVSHAVSDTTLSLDFASDENGMAVLVLQAEDDFGATATAVVTVMVNAVNDAPEITKATLDITLAEDQNGGVYSHPGFATDISAGPNESDDLLIDIVTDNPGMFSVLPTISLATGDFDFTVAPNANGEATVSVSLSDSGVRRLYGVSQDAGGASALHELDPTTGAATVIGQIGFNGISAIDFSANDGLLYAVGYRAADGVSVLITIDTDTGMGMEVGPTGIEDLNGRNVPDMTFNENGTVLYAYMKRSSDDQLIVLNTSTGAATSVGNTNVDGQGNGLGFSPMGNLVNAGGTALNILSNVDGSGTFQTDILLPDPAIAAPGIDSTLSVNDSHRLAALDFCPGTSTLFGAAKYGEEGGSGGHFLAVLDTVSGVVSIIGRSVDGLDAIAWSAPSTSASMDIEITVIPVNDEPTFDLSQTAVGIVDDRSPHMISNFATNISPGGGADETSQSLAFDVVVDTPELFTANGQPAINALSGDLTFTPVIDAVGVATVTVTLFDNGANGGVNNDDNESEPSVFTISITESSGDAGIGGIWLLDASSGTTAVDSSGNGNNGTANAGATIVTGVPANAAGTGKPVSNLGNARDFNDAAAGKITIPNNSSLQFATGKVVLSAWINYDARLRADSWIAGKGTFSTAANGPSLFLQSDGKIRFALGQAASHYVRSGGTTVTNTWYHVAGTYDGLTMKVYINGNLSGSKSLSGNNLSNNEPFEIGGSGPGATYSFNGRIDEVHALDNFDNNTVSNLVAGTRFGGVAQALLSGHTQDDDCNGLVDAIKINFGSNVDLNTVDVNDFATVPAVSNLAVATGGVDTYSSMVVLTFDESAVLTTGAEFTVDFTSGTLETMDGDPVDDASITTIDKAPPVIADAPSDITLDVDDGVLKIAFSEEVDDGSVNLSRIYLVDTSDSDEISLAGAGASVANNEVCITLTNAQRETLYSFANIVVDVDVAAVRDLAGNPNKQQIGLPISVSGDVTGPIAVSATLKLNNGLLTVVFSESIDSVLTDLSGAALSGLDDNTDPVDVDLEDALVVGVNGSSLLLLLTESQRVDVLAIVSGHALDLAFGSVADLIGNPSENVDDLPVTVAMQDTTAPKLLDALVDYSNAYFADEDVECGTGIAMLLFSEAVSAVDLGQIHLSDTVGGNDVSLDNSDVVILDVVADDLTSAALFTSAFDEDNLFDDSLVTGNPGSVVVVFLNEAARADAYALSVFADDTDSVIVELGVGAATDVVGNDNDAQSLVALEFEDIVAPEVIAASLNYDTGVLTIDFCETVDVSSLNLSDLSLSADAGDFINDLDAFFDIITTVDANATSISIQLDDSTRDTALALSGFTPPAAGDGLGTAVFLDASDFAFRDIADNGNDPSSSTEVDESADVRPPLAVSVHVDYNTGELTVTFDKVVSDLDLSAGGVRLENTEDATTVTVSDQTPEINGHVVDLTLSADQIATARPVSSDPAGDGTALELAIDSGVVTDLLDSLNDGQTGIPVTEVTDTPVVTGVEIDFNDNVSRLTITVSEDVNIGSMGLDGVRVMVQQSALATSLLGSEFTNGPSVDGNEITIELTEEERVQLLGGCDANAEFCSAFDGGAVTVDILEGVVADDDLDSGTPNVAQLGITASVICDIKSPAVSTMEIGSPVLLDLGTGELSIVFDETIDADATDLSLCHINAQVGKNLINLGGATVVSSGCVTTLEIVLTEEQRMVAVDRAGEIVDGDNETFVLECAAGAVFDISGNANGDSPAIAIELTSDSVDPEIVHVTSSKADGVYGPGEIIDIDVEFSEKVVASGQLRLALNTGREAVILGGSGTSTLTFRYVVQFGDETPEGELLDYVDVNSLTGTGGISDPSGNPCDPCVLPVAGGAGSLIGAPASKSIVIKRLELVVEIGVGESDGQRENQWVSVSINADVTDLQTLAFPIVYDGTQLEFLNKDMLSPVAGDLVTAGAHVAAFVDDTVVSESIVWIVIDRADGELAVNGGEGTVVDLLFRLRVGAGGTDLGDFEEIALDAELLSGQIVAIDGEGANIALAVVNGTIDVNTLISLLDIDENGRVEFDTDGLIIYRAALYGHLNGLVPIVPEEFRENGDCRIADVQVLANVDAYKNVDGGLDVDLVAAFETGRDAVYIFRRLRTLPMPVGTGIGDDEDTAPAGHALDMATIDIINANIDGLVEEGEDTLAPQIGDKVPNVDGDFDMTSLIGSLDPLEIRFHESIRVRGGDNDGVLIGDAAVDLLDEGILTVAHSQDVEIEVREDSRVIVITPPTAWNNSSSVSVDLDAIQDVAGNSGVSVD